MNRVLEILQQTGAVMTLGHFVGASGRHFDLYINKDALLPHTQAVSEIGKIFAEKYQNLDLDLVLGPALGGIFLSQWTAYHLSVLKGREILSLYTEKTQDGQQIFTRGNEQWIRGKKALILEDCVTTGESVRKVINSVLRAEGQVAAVCVMVNKDPKNIHLDALAELPVVTYAAEDCPLCKDRIPINTTVGHGRKLCEIRR